MTTDERKQSATEYRDDPKDFGQSSETANRGTSSGTSGDKPGEAGDAAGAKGKQDWKGHYGDAGARETERAMPNDPLDGKGGADDVKSRSADPGQSSYGGFKDEGPSEQSSGSS